MSADDNFFQGLRHLGWTEGQNILIERHFAAGNADQLKESAAELTARMLDLTVPPTLLSVADEVIE